ncbi:MAG TPA: ferrochelatase, partial [Thalassobaculum sp.]
MAYRLVDTVAGVPDHPSIRLGRIGVLLVNLGTPDSTSVADVRRYLAEFLSDRRVIEVNPVLWKLVLHAVILRTRPPRTAEAYRAVWMAGADGSPLRHHTRAAAEALQARLDPGAAELRVDWAMRYGNPAIRERLTALQDEGCDRILVLPLYPQYSATTTGTVVDEVARQLLAVRWQPALRTVPAYHDDGAYIDALASGVETHLASL